MIHVLHGFIILLITACIGIILQAIDWLFDDQIHKQNKLK